MVAGNEIKNIREEEAELEDAPENTLDDEDIREDKIKNISKEEQKFEDASEDALDDEDIGEDQVKSKDPNEGRSMPENGGNETLSRTMKKIRIIWLAHHNYHPTVMYIDKVRWEITRISLGKRDQSNMEKQTPNPRRGEKSKNERVI